MDQKIFEVGDYILEDHKVNFTTTSTIKSKGCI